MPLAPADVAGPPAPVRVGADGNEPQVVVGPDGTIFVGALQQLYRSTNGGASFTLVNDVLDHLSIASDSSLAFDPAGRLYYAADWPYAGHTEVCTSDDRGDSWLCNYAALAGVTDRMWVVAPTTTDAFLVSNQGLYFPTLLWSNTRGITWVPVAESSVPLSPQTGPLVVAPGRVSPVLQPTKSAGLAFVDYGGVGSVPATRATGLPAPLALPSGAYSTDGVLWTASEKASPTGGYSLVVGRSADHGRTWRAFDVPTPGLATVTFSWVAAGAPGHVGVVFYGTPVAGHPNTMPSTASWGAYFAESRNANSAAPTWTVTTLEAGVHEGPICIALGCADRFAGDFISATIDANDVAHAAWMKNGAPPTIRYARP